MAARVDGLDRLHLNLTVRKFRAQSKPKLALKVADGRHLLPILLKVLQLFFPAGSPRERVMVGCVETLCDIYKELNTWDTTASPPRVTSLARRHVILLREFHYTSDSPHSTRGSIRSSSGAKVMKVGSAWWSRWLSAATRATSRSVCWNVTRSLTTPEVIRNEARTKAHAHFLTTNGHAQAHEHFRTGNGHQRTHERARTRTDAHTHTRMRLAHNVFQRLYLW